MRPIETTQPITFTYEDVTYKRTAPNKYVKVIGDTEVSVEKETSNDLMEALLAGEIVKTDKAVAR
jgi:hypothetical protein